MNIYKKSGLVALISLALLGCSEQKIDASSIEKMQLSTQKVRENLSEKDKEDFDEALQLIYQRWKLDDDPNKETMESLLILALDQQSGKDVISKGDALKLEIKEKKEKERITKEVQELEKSREFVQKSIEKLKEFEIINSRFYKVKRFIGKDAPIIELTVKNNTGIAISKVVFDATLKNPNRTIPWLNESFTYSISGGVEPDEEVIWSLAPKNSSAWIKIDDPDAILTLSVSELYGPDEERLYSNRVFNEKDNERLMELTFSPQETD